MMERYAATTPRNAAHLALQRAMIDTEGVSARHRDRDDRA
jgi:hypothetical protein